MIRFLGLIVFALLAGCQSRHVADDHPVDTHKINKYKTQPVQKKSVLKRFTARKIAMTDSDGPPPGPLPVKFNKVAPKTEPLSRYGNPGAYQVNGQSYEVMTSSSGYRARGLASWYGTKFHTRRTSSGEDYDLYELTAAHKTLPLPTYVRVRNLNNGQVAIVKVNDRGPFHEGRIIDLSYGAAVKLGLLPKGTAPVEIEALTTKQHQAHYYVQAGAFSSDQLAQALRSKLAKLTPSPVFIEKYKGLHVVSVGPFAEKSMSDKLKVTLASNGVSGVFSLMK